MWLVQLITQTYEVSDFSDSQCLEKMQKLIRKLPKRFANCQLRASNSNPGQERQVCLESILLDIFRNTYLFDCCFAAES